MSEGTASLIAFIIFIIVWFCFMTCAVQRESDRRRRESESDGSTAGDRKQRERVIKSKLRVHEWHDDDTTVCEDSLAAANTAAAVDNKDNGSFLDRRMERLRQISSLRASDDLSSMSSSFHEEAGCAICLTNFESGQHVCEASNIQCSHVFHEECMACWLLKHSRCPMCRASYLKETV